MKKLVAVMVAFSFSSYAHAQGSLKRGIEAVSNPTLLGQVDCDDPNAPAWCKDLYKKACEVQKSSDKLGTLSKVIDSRTYDKLPQNPKEHQVNDAGEAAIKMADELVYKQGKVIRKEVVDTFVESKSILYQLITSSPYINSAKKMDMKKALESTNLRTGYEYVEDLIKYGAAQDPRAPREQLRRNALEQYMSSCGGNGLDINAFYHYGYLVLCPGLVYSLEDYNANKTEILNALSFTIGHELGHAIDYGKHPSVYSKFRTCYENVTNNKDLFKSQMGNEIVGDYWGTLVLSQRLKNQKISGENAVRTVGLSIDGFCPEASSGPQNNDPRPPEHPDAQFRVNMTMARAPLMREVLGCDAPSIDHPACWLDGMLTRPVSSR